MRSKTATWFETKVKYDKTQENGLLKTVREQYVFDSLTFSEAEQSTIEELSNYISGEYKVVDIKPASYAEVFFSDNGQDDKWYKAKLAFVTVDEKTQKEKRTNICYLVQARSLPVAVKYIEEEMSNTMVGYIFVGINETAIIDVYEHKTTE